MITTKQLIRIREKKIKESIKDDLNFYKSIKQGQVIKAAKHSEKSDKKVIECNLINSLINVSKRTELLDLVHKEDKNKKGYYLCIHAVGPGKPHKLTKQWKKVTCMNCLSKKRKKK